MGHSPWRSLRDRRHSRQPGNQRRQMKRFLQILTALAALAAVMSWGASPLRGEAGIRFESRLGIAPTGEEGNFGSSVDVEGNLMVVGDEIRDCAYVFSRSQSGTWRREATLRPSSPGFPGNPLYFGNAVAISGDTIAVGSRLRTAGPVYIPDGGVFVFSRSGQDWVETDFLLGSGIPNGGQFGSSLVFVGGQLFVGAPYRGGGEVFQFGKEGGQWVEKAKITSPSLGQVGFGASIAIRGDFMVVGSPFEDPSSVFPFGGNLYGAAYLFQRTGGTWQQIARLAIANSEVFQRFGSSVAVSEDGTVLIGSPGSSQATGAVHVFRRESGVWVKSATLKAPNPGADDEFGGALVVSGDLLLVSASGEASSAQGVNGDQADNSDPNSGAAYLFRRVSSNWQELAYLKSSHTMEGSFFAHSLAMSGTTVVVGAKDERDMDNVNGIPVGGVYTYRVPPPQTRISLQRVPRRFQDTTVAKKGRPQAILLKNMGARDARGIRFAIEGPGRRDFILRGAPKVIRAGKTARVRVTFSPCRIGFRRGLVRITGNFGTKSVGLFGAGTPKSPRLPNLDF